MLKDYRVMITGKERAELVECPLEEGLSEGQILGENLMSLISTGSERSGYTQQFRPEQYPMQTGSSSIARVVGVGPGVKGYQTGDLFFHGEHHTKYTVLHESDTVSVPAGLEPEKALFGRYAAVSMTSVFRMRAKAVDRIIVTGLGLVGLMGAQMLNCLGYEVYAVDPSPDRRAIAAQTNLTNIAASLEEWPHLKKSAGGMIECSGNENALRSALPFMRPNSDIFQVGVPWEKKSDWDAHTLLYDLFYSYVSLHGGWEWFLPKKPTEFEPHSNYYHISSAMKLIAENKVIVVPEMYELCNPQDCNQVYQDIAVPKMCPVSMMFDWSRLKA